MVLLLSTRLDQEMYLALPRSLPTLQPSALKIKPPIFRITFVVWVALLFLRRCTHGVKIFMGNGATNFRSWSPNPAANEQPEMIAYNASSYILGNWLLLKVAKTRSAV